MDAALRLLERQAAVGDRGAEVRLLVERLRAGQVEMASVRLAALADDPVARTLLGTSAPRAPSALTLKQWCACLAEFGKPIAVRVAVTAAERLLPVYERLDWRAPIFAIANARRWLEDASEENPDLLTYRLPAQ